MAETPPSPDEQALRRRARRRLVGAIALALLAVVVLPMVFDPEPRPMGNNVDIRIPGQDAPFESAPAAPSVAAAVPGAPAPTPAVALAPTASPEKMASAAPPAKAEPAAKPVQTNNAKSDKKPVAAAQAKPAPKVEAKQIPKREVKPKPEEVAKPVEAAKPPIEKKPAESKAAAAGQAYFLQLGVFSSEANAKQMVAQAQKAGFKSSIMPVGGQFKVRIGPIPDRAKALDYEAKLKAKGLAAVLVEP